MVAARKADTSAPPPSREEFEHHLRAIAATNPAKMDELLAWGRKLRAEQEAASAASPKPVIEELVTTLKALSSADLKTVTTYVRGVAAEEGATPPPVALPSLLAQWHELGGRLAERGDVDLGVALRAARQRTTGAELPAPHTRDSIAAWFCRMVERIHELAGTDGLSAVWMILEHDRDFGEPCRGGAGGAAPISGAIAELGDPCDPYYCTPAEREEVEKANRLPPARLAAFLRACDHHMRTVLARADGSDIEKLVGMVDGGTDGLDDWSPLDPMYAVNMPTAHEEVEDAIHDLVRCIGGSRPQHNAEVANAIGRLAYGGAAYAMHYSPHSTERIGTIAWMACRALVAPPPKPKPDRGRRKARAARAATKRRVKTAARGGAR